MKPVDAISIFNSDCNFYATDNFGGPGRFSANFFYDYCKRLAKGGVDTVMVNYNAQLPWYPSKRVPNILTGYTRDDHDFVRGQYPPTNKTDFTEKDLANRCRDFCSMLNRYVDLVEDGKDWLAEYSLACRANGLKPWLTVRMNDMHGMNSWEKSPMNCALQKDPRYRLPGRELNPADGFAYRLQCLDYKHKKVRDYMFDVIAEPVEDYDYEGLELDWLRCVFCLDPMDAKKHSKHVTELIEQIRDLTQTRAKKIGKPYPLGLRIPPRLGQLKAYGLDVEGWAKAGLIDFVSSGNFWQGNWDIPFDDLKRKLGPNVAVYGCVDTSPNQLMTRPKNNKGRETIRYTPQCKEIARGQAAGKLALGCDGLEYFNFFVTPDGDGRYETFGECRTLDGLRSTEKQYCQANALGFYQFPWFEHADSLPLTLDWQRKAPLRFAMAAEPGRVKMKVQLILTKVSGKLDLGVSFNGAWPTFKAQETDTLLYPAGDRVRHSKTHRVLEFVIDSPEIHDGWNELIIVNGGSIMGPKKGRKGRPVTIQGAEIAVKPM